MSKVKDNLKAIKKIANKLINKPGLKYGLTVFHIIMAIVLFIKAIKPKKLINEEYKKETFEFVMGILILIFGTMYGLLLILGNSS
jgi:hypothetical protein